MNELLMELRHSEKYYMCRTVITTCASARLRNFNSIPGVCVHMGSSVM